MVEGSLSHRIAGSAGRAVTRPGRVGGWLSRDDAKRLAWRTLWAPFWVGSDVPAPDAPAREPARPADIGLAGDVVVKGLDQIRRRLWLRHALTVVVRAVWLGLAIGCLWLLVELAGGPALDAEWLIWVAAAVGLLGVAFAAMARPGRRQTARMLDRSFELQERLTTAVDHLGRGVPQPGQRAPVVYLQMADAANVVA